MAINGGGGSSNLRNRTGGEGSFSLSRVAPLNPRDPPLRPWPDLLGPVGCVLARRAKQVFPMRAPARCRDGSLAVFQELVSNNRIGKMLLRTSHGLGGVGWVWLTPGKIELPCPALRVAFAYSVMVLAASWLFKQSCRSGRCAASSSPRSLSISRGRHPTIFHSSQARQDSSVHHRTSPVLLGPVKNIVRP